MELIDEQKWLATIRLQADGRGNIEFYEMLMQEVNDRKKQWKVLDEGGDFTSDELTKLIQNACSVIQFIEQRKGV